MNKKGLRNIARIKPFTLFLLGLVVSCGAFFAQPTVTHAEEDITAIAKKMGTTLKADGIPKAAIVVNADSGEILWSQQPDLAWNPASIAKVMTMYLAFEAMEQGKFTMDTTVTATQKDVDISKIYAISNNKITLGVAYPVRELLKMIAVPSSNVATLMLANLISGNQPTDFVHLMNQKAAELGMTNTTYYNCSGAQASAFNGLYQMQGIDPNGDNVSTARDLASLTYHFLKNYPEILEITNKPVVKTMVGTPYEETFEAYNYSLPGAKYGYQGVDGLKTGSSPTGGFNYIATVKQGDFRLIEVILGVGNWQNQDGEYERHVAGNALLDYAYTTYERKKLLDKGPQTIDHKKVTLANDLYGVVPKGSQPTFKLVAGQVQVDTPLTLLNSTVQAPKVAYQEVKPKQTTAEAAEESNEHSGDTTVAEPNHFIPKSIATSVLVLFGLIFSVITRQLQKRLERQKKHGKESSKTASMRTIFLSAAVLSFLCAIGLFLLF